MNAAPAFGFVTSVGPFRLCASHGLYRSAVGLTTVTNPTMREAVYELRIPRAYFFGERSLPDQDTERLVNRGIDIVTISDAGHAMALDNPVGVAHAIRRTLDLTGS